MIVGSLIKKPRRRPCAHRRVHRRYAKDLRGPLRLPPERPRLGQEVGANLGLMPAFYQGFFLAPTVTAGALKGAVFAANVYERLGFPASPNAAEPRHDIIHAWSSARRSGWLPSAKRAFRRPHPWTAMWTPSAMPGYDSQVIMAAGAFVQGCVH